MAPKPDLASPSALQARSLGHFGLGFRVHGLRSLGLLSSWGLRVSDLRVPDCYAMNF